MAKAYYKDCNKGALFLYNEVMLRFNMLYHYMCEDVISTSEMLGAEPVSVISILVTENITSNIDLGIAVGDVFRRFNVQGISDIKLVTALHSEGSKKVHLTRTGKFQNIQYTQHFFLYDVNIDVLAILTKLQKIHNYKIITD